MATLRTEWTRSVALVGLLLLATLPGTANATPCGPEEDTTIESRWTGVYDSRCYGECDTPASAPSLGPDLKIEMEAVEETEGTWYRVRIQRGEKTSVLAGVTPGSGMDAREWGSEQGKSPLSKLGGAAVMDWVSKRMEMPPVEFAGWAKHEKVPVGGGPDGGKGGSAGAVPEPTAALLFGAGFAITAARRRATA
jgi:hypothetical protein